MIGKIEDTRWEIQNDKVVRLVPMPELAIKGHPACETCSMEMIIDKETFIKCYNQWIKEIEE